MKYFPDLGAMTAVRADAIGLVFPDFSQPTEPFKMVAQDAVVEIEGPLFQKPRWCFDNYESIGARCEAAFGAPNTRRVILKINSPGGDLAGCFELAAKLRSLSEKSGKELIAYADGCCASAAYALASSAAKIYLPATSQVGSIGIVRQLADQVSADRAMGLNYVLVTSGIRKLDGHPHVPVSEGAVAEVQAQVNTFAEMFFTNTAALRPRTSADALRSLQGGVLYGQAAVSAGLADAVMTWDELISGAASNLKGESIMANEYKDIVAALEKMAEGEDANAVAAKAALAKLRAEDKPAETDEDKKKKEEEATKAAADPPPAPKEDEDKATKAILSLTSKVQALQTKLDAKEAAELRATMIASRPDLPPETLVALEKVPTSTLQATLDAIPKLGGLTSISGEIIPNATLGKTVGKLPETVAARAVHEAMGTVARMPEIKDEGSRQVFPAMNAEQARAFMRQRAEAKVKGV